MKLLFALMTSLLCAHAFATEVTMRQLTDREELIFLKSLGCGNHLPGNIPPCSDEVSAFQVALENGIRFSAAVNNADQTTTLLNVRININGVESAPSKTQADEICDTLFSGYFWWSKTSTASQIFQLTDRVDLTCK